MRKIKKSRELELLEEIKKSIDELKKKRYFELGEERYHPYPNPDNPYGYWWNGTVFDDGTNGTISVPSIWGDITTCSGVTTSTMTGEDYFVVYQ